MNQSQNYGNRFRLALVRLRTGSDPVAWRPGRAYLTHKPFVVFVSCRRRSRPLAVNGLIDSICSRSAINSTRVTNGPVSGARPSRAELTRDDDDRSIKFTFNKPTASYRSLNISDRWSSYISPKTVAGNDTDYARPSVRPTVLLASPSSRAFLQSPAAAPRVQPGTRTATPVIEDLLKIYFFGCFCCKAFEL